VSFFEPGYQGNYAGKHRLHGGNGDAREPDSAFTGQVLNETG
jgi:hypothetical protein